jgi:hypothetical protein
MKRTGYGTKIGRGILLSIALVSAWVAWMPQRARASDRDGTSVTKQISEGDSVKQSGARPEKAPAMKIYIDPETGNFSEPPTQPVPTESQKSFDASKELAPELRQVPSPRPGGGVMIDLKGRFRNPLTVNRRVDGKRTLGHSSEPANSSEKK